MPNGPVKDQHGQLMARNDEIHAGHIQSSDDENCFQLRFVIHITDVTITY